MRGRKGPKPLVVHRVGVAEELKLPLLALEGPLKEIALPVCEGAVSKVPLVFSDRILGPLDVLREGEAGEVHVAVHLSVSVQ
jgi:hypothetical protein